MAVGMAAQTAAPSSTANWLSHRRGCGSSVTGQPLSGVTVSITATENRQSSQTMETGADGRFAFPALPAAKYSLTASARGYRAQGFNQHDNFFTGIAVGPDLDGGNLVFRLVPDAAIEGIVTDDDGEAVRNANVQLFQRNQRQRPAAHSDDLQRSHRRPRPLSVRPPRPRDLLCRRVGAAMVRQLLRARRALRPIPTMQRVWPRRRHNSMSLTR